MSPGKLDRKKPRVVALGTPKYIGDDYLAEFAKDFDYAVRFPPGPDSRLARSLTHSALRSSTRQTARRRRPSCPP